jgi:hypothetical protein
MGNGGFSLRSRRLLELSQTLHFDPNSAYDGDWVEDQVICVEGRRRLELEGIRFATKTQGKTFSREHPMGWQKTLGFHAGFQIPYYLTKLEFIDWMDHIDPIIFQGKSLYLTFYGLHQRGWYDVARSFMRYGQRHNPNWVELVMKEHAWMIPNHVNRGENMKALLTAIATSTTGLQ